MKQIVLVLIFAFSFSNVSGADRMPEKIVVMGQDRLQTVQAIPLVIEKLKMAGYRFVTVSELLALDPSFP